MVQGGLDRLDHRPVVVRRTDGHEEEDEDQEGDYEVGHRAGQDDDGALPHRLGSERPGILFGSGFLEGVHPCDSDISARGDGLHAILRLPSPERPQARPEADEELLDLDAEQLGGEEVAGLVDHHHDDEGHDEKSHAEGCGHWGWPFLARPYRDSMISAARPRAHRSARSSATSETTGAASCSSRTAATTSGIWTSRFFPSRNAMT